MSHIIKKNKKKLCGLSRAPPCKFQRLRVDDFISSARALKLSSCSTTQSRVKNTNLEAQSFHLLQDRRQHKPALNEKAAIEAFSLPIPKSGEGVG